MKHGGKRPGAGRPAGSQNADTAAMRAALSGLLEGQVAVAGVCQRSCPSISCGVSDFRGAGFGFGVQPYWSGGLPVSGFT